MNIHHGLRIRHSQDEIARQHFVMGMRSYVLNDLAGSMRKVYDQKIEPNFRRKHDRAPTDGPEVHKAMKPDTIFKFYSSLRVNTQESVWRSVMPAVERNAEDLRRRAQILRQSTENAEGTLSIDPNFEVPRYVSDIDVHLLPGGYQTEYMEDDVSQGAVMDNGKTVFTMGLTGDEGDDITMSVATYLSHRHPNFRPRKILDMGCTMGNSTLPWAKIFPDAEVHGIDVAAPMLRYGHAQAQSKGITTHFHQMNCEAPDFEDESFDLVYSCMLLHELPKKTIHNTFQQARRMLKPDGLMLHYELPPNNIVEPYDSFYLDWDSYYNKEPFYKAFRDTDPSEECEQAGFAIDKTFQFVTPSLHSYGEEAVRKAAKTKGSATNDRVGRLVGGVQWFCFGAWK